MRDFQVSKIYASERILEPAHPNLTTRQAQQYANRILKTPTWKRLSPHNTGVVIHRKRPGHSIVAQTSIAESNNMIIRLAPIHHNRISVTHEMAHILTGRLFGTRVPAHGSHYAWIFRCLIEDIRTKADFLKWESEALRLGVEWSSKPVEAKSRFHNN